MDDQHKQAVADIKAKVGRGDYVVDPVAVAEALLKRLRQQRSLRMDACDQRSVEPADDPADAQTECSYPRSAWPASEKVARGVPARTRPIQVRPKRSGWLAAAVSATLRALGGTHAQSS
jgi:hypothetical protein